MDLGYIAVAVSIAVWLTGTAFLERLRDSLFFHGTLSSALAGLVMVHAATSNVNIPFVLSEIILGATLLIMLANATFHLSRAVPRGQPQRVAKT
jgi:multisubunit Na+/H+ antiporter MnhE subunit